MILLARRIASPGEPCINMCMLDAPACDDTNTVGASGDITRLVRVDHVRLASKSGDIT